MTWSPAGHQDVLMTSTRRAVPIGAASDAAAARRNAAHRWRCALRNRPLTHSWSARWV